MGDIPKVSGICDYQVDHVLIFVIKKTYFFQGMCFMVLFIFFNKNLAVVEILLLIPMPKFVFKFFELYTYCKLPVVITYVSGTLVLMWVFEIFF